MSDKLAGCPRGDPLRPQRHAKPAIHPEDSKSYQDNVPVLNISHLPTSRAASNGDLCKSDSSFVQPLHVYAADTVSSALHSGGHSSSSASLDSPPKRVHLPSGGDRASEHLNTSPPDAGGDSRTAVVSLDACSVFPGAALTNIQRTPRGGRAAPSRSGHCGWEADMEDSFGMSSKHLPRWEASDAEARVVRPHSHDCIAVVCVACPATRADLRRWPARACHLSQCAA
jgi:hypothetical protein